MKFVKKVELGDPSSNKQTFTNLKLKLLCCRYWALDLWDCHDMVFPFWRIYWNKNRGGELKHHDDIYKMDPNFIYIIAPFTSFSTKISKKHIYSNGIHVSGRHITEHFNEEDVALLVRGLSRHIALLSLLDGAVHLVATGCHS